MDSCVLLITCSQDSPLLSVRGYLGISNANLREAKAGSVGGGGGTHQIV